MAEKSDALTKTIAVVSQPYADYLYHDYPSKQVASPVILNNVEMILKSHVQLVPSIAEIPPRRCIVHTYHLLNPQLAVHFGVGAVVTIGADNLTLF